MINGQEISDDQSFRSYVTNIENISTGTKHYNTYEELLEDVTAKADDVALVYNINESHPELDVAFNNMWFPKKVKVGTITDIGNYISGNRYRSWNINKYLRNTDTTKSSIKINLATYYNSGKYVYNTITISLGSEEIIYRQDEDFYFIRQDDSEGTLSLTDAMNNEYIFNSSDFADSVSDAYVFDRIIQLIWSIGDNNFTGLYRWSNVYNEWQLAPTQFSTRDGDVADKLYYGSNGASRGTLLDTKYIYDNNVNDAKYYLNICNKIYNSLDSTNIQVSSTMGTFRDAKYIDWFTLSNNMTTANYMFSDFKNLQYLNVANWDTSALTSTINMFNFCQKLRDIDITNKLNFGNVVNASHMFAYSGILNLYNATNMDFSNTVNMAYMFFQTDLTYIPLNTWNLDNVTNGFSMFSNCGKLDFNCINVRFPKLEDASYMFTRTGFAIGGTNYWGNGQVAINAPNVSNMYQMFGNCKLATIMNFTQSNLGTLASNICTEYMFSEDGNLRYIQNLRFGNGNLKSTAYMFNNCGVMRLLSSNLNMTSVENALSMFANCRSINNLSTILTGNLSNLKIAGGMFNFCNEIQNIPLTSANMAMPNLIDAHSMFAYCSNLTQVNINWNMPNLSDASSMFYNTNVRNYAMSGINFANLKNIYQMFGNRTASIQMQNSSMPLLNNFQISLGYDSNAPYSIINLNNLNIPNVTNFRIQGQKITEINLYNVNTGLLDSLYYSFSGSTAVTNLNLASFKYKEGFNNLVWAFSGCSNLLTVEFGNNLNLEASENVNAESMFSGCYNLKNINNIDFSNVKFKSTKQMFNGCYNIDNLYINTTYTTSMEAMFSTCYRLNNISITDTSNVSYMSSAFYNCQLLTNIPENLYINNCTSMMYTFSGCYNLVNIAPNFNTANAPSSVHMGYLFANCRNLVEVDTTNFNICKSNNISQMFIGCNNLSNNSVQNIINMILTGVNIVSKNISNKNTSSPFYNTIYDSSYYTDRLSELSEAGWSY